MPTPVVYAAFKLKQNNGNAINFDTPGGNGIKVMFVTSSYTPDSEAHDFIDDVSANEVSGTGYTAGGVAVTNTAIALDGGTAEWSHDDVTISQNAGGFSDARYAVWYHDTGTESTSKLIMYMDLSSDRGNVSGDLTLDADAGTGVLQIS